MKTIYVNAPMTNQELEKLICKEEDAFQVDFSHEVESSDFCPSYRVFDLVDENQESFEVTATLRDAEPNSGGKLFKYDIEY